MSHLTHFGDDFTGQMTQPCHSTEEQWSVRSRANPTRLSSLNGEEKHVTKKNYYTKCAAMDNTKSPHI